MLRYLPVLLLFFAACSTDPLELNVVDFKDVAGDEGYRSIENFSSPWLAEHEELTLQLSFRAPAGARGRIMLQGQYPLELPSLSLQGATPLINVDLAPGIWHDLEVQFQPARDGTPAIIPAVYLDGNPVYYSEVLKSTGADAGPLSFVSETGDIEFADVLYAPVAGRSSTVNEDGLVELNVPLLRYEYFHIPEGSTSFSGWNKDTPVKTGYINRIDLSHLREKSIDYALRFTGTLHVPKSATYRFDTWGTGMNAFYLDGDYVTGAPGAPDSRNGSATVALEAGDHSFEHRIVQHKHWNVSRISYKEVGTEEEPRLLNSMDGKVAIAVPASKNPRILDPGNEPYLLRSFLYFPAPKLYEQTSKRTHVVSVGEGNGPHYSVDLQTGALLQAWRGDFADVHDMWDGRGEPQVMRPLGPAIQFDGTPLVAPSAADRWPDPPAEPDTDDFRHFAYELDEQGRPTFEYGNGEHFFTDKIVPEGKNLVREITHIVGGNGAYYVQLAAARSIVEVALGEFELRGPGMKLRIEGYDGGGLTLQRSGGQERLIAEMAAKGFIRYRMEW